VVELTIHLEANGIYCDKCHLIKISPKSHFAYCELFFMTKLEKEEKAFKRCVKCLNAEKRQKNV